MSQQVINLTKLFTIREIQTILFKFTKEKENVRAKFILENQYYQQKLIEYVLSHINHRYMSMEFTEIPKEASKILPHCPITEKIKIRQLILMGMSIIAQDLLTQNIINLTF